MLHKIDVGIPIRNDVRNDVVSYIEKGEGSYIRLDVRNEVVSYVGNDVTSGIGIGNNEIADVVFYVRNSPL